MDSTATLDLVSSKNSLRKDQNGRAAKRFDILAKFVASFMEDFESIQNLPVEVVTSLLHGVSSCLLQVLVVSSLSILPVFVVIIRH